MFLQSHSDDVLKIIQDLDIPPYPESAAATIGSVGPLVPVTFAADTRFAFLRPSLADAKSPKPGLNTTIPRAIYYDFDMRREKKEAVGTSIRARNMDVSNTASVVFLDPLRFARFDIEDAMVVPKDVHLMVAFPTHIWRLTSVKENGKKKSVCNFVLFKKGLVAQYGIPLTASSGTEVLLSVQYSRFNVVVDANPTQSSVLAADVTEAIVWQEITGNQGLRLSVVESSSFPVEPVKQQQQHYHQPQEAHFKLRN
jgi:hypothetical protein